MIIFGHLNTTYLMANMSAFLMSNSKLEVQGLCLLFVLHAEPVFVLN